MALGAPPGRRLGEVRTRAARVYRAVAVLLVGVPLLIAVAGPALAGLIDAPPGRPYTAAGPLGTDMLGRDVLRVLLLGGRPLVFTAVTAVALGYLVGGPIGSCAAASRWRWLDELLLRPLDVILALPSLLLISVAAVWWHAETLTLIAVVAVVNVPHIARLVRTATLDAAGRPVVEAMRLQGESWFRIQVGYLGRAVFRPVAADAGTRIALAVYVVASANFLGLGLGPASPDWAVAVAQNRDGLTLQPWAVLAPTAMIVAFTVGVNLLWDDLLRTAGRPRTRTRRRRPTATGGRR